MENYTEAIADLELALSIGGVVGEEYRKIQISAAKVRIMLPELLPRRGAASLLACCASWRVAPACCSCWERCSAHADGCHHTPPAGVGPLLVLLLLLPVLLLLILLLLPLAARTLRP